MESSLPQMTTCRFCHGEVAQDALKCRHCSEWLSTASKPSDLPTFVKASKDAMISCQNCGYSGVPSKTRKWDTGVTIILFIFMIIPAIIYDVWRGPEYYQCPKCKNHKLAVTFTEKTIKEKSRGFGKNLMIVLLILFVGLPVLIGILSALSSEL